MRHASRVKRWKLLSGAVVSVLTMAPAAALAADTGYAWVWAGNSTGDYIPHASYAYNSRGGTLRVVNVSTGDYRVDITHFTGSGGNVQVSAYGYGSERCKVRNWYPSATNTLSINIRCHDVAGNLVNTRFIALYNSQQLTTPGGQWGAYLWTDSPSATSSYTPSATYQWNASGLLSTVVRTSTGNYNVTLTGQTSEFPSSLLVTAYGDGSEYCKLVNWGTGSTSTSNMAYVRCFAANGQPADSRFTLSYFTSSPTLNAPTGFVWAHDKVSATYTPYAWYQFNSYGGTNTAGRSSLGSFWVQYPGLKATGPTDWGWSASSTTLVTAYGFGSEHCKVGGWGNSGDGARVSISCFDATGNLVDTQFNQAFMNNDFLPPQ